jgi:hypothetical protein
LGVLFSLGADCCGLRPSLVGVRGVSPFPAAGDGILDSGFRGSLEGLVVR